MPEAPPQFPQVYRIETPRLIVRCLEPSDAPHIVEAITASLDHLLAWLPWAKDEPQTIDSKLALILRQRPKFDMRKDFSFAVCDRITTELIGMIGGHNRIGAGAREIGYWIRIDRSRQGLMTEAASGLIRIGFEVDKLRRMEIQCEPTNLASAAIPRKLGFTHARELRNRVIVEDGPIRDTSIWVLKSADYPSSPAASVEMKAFDAIGRTVELCRTEGLGT
jgi:RimJ/RimL family protein N-acetyltransferase